MRSQGKEQVGEPLTYGALDLAARRIAAGLLARWQPGSRVLLLHPSGTAFVTAFVGCHYAGMVPVPAPAPTNQNRQGARTATIAADAGVAAVLCESSQVDLVTAFVDESGLDEVAIIASDELEGDAEAWTPPELAADTVAILQYTSGSTSDPKGVVVTHGSLMHNLALIADAFGVDQDTRSCSWLPLYHDMGLVGMLLTPLYLNATVIMLSPTDFLRRPHMWLSMVQRHGVSFITAPNFAYDLCTRTVTDDQLSTMDLSGVRYALNGSEPLHAATLDRFADRFGAAGFPRPALKPCYGMAEATLFISCTPTDRGPAVTAVDATALERHEFVPAEGGRDLVSSGRVRELDVRIVDPDTRLELTGGRIGEIWVRGGSVAAGYWNRPADTDRTFRAVTAGGEGPFLRTGDLGVLHEGELYVTGRIKDMLIIRGRNLYPQDIERDVAGMHDAFQGLNGSVCSVPAEQEEIVVMQELRPRGKAELDLAGLARDVRGRLAEQLGVRVSNMVFLRPGQVLRTSSGKVRRANMRDLFMTGGLTPIYEELDAATARLYRVGAR
jgi:acyl-CoA synthetase (AMP-forming)/AMP-acid ligase II